MSTQPTPTGWIDTVVTEHMIKICKRIAKVNEWNQMNIEDPSVTYDNLVCFRCQTFWSSLPDGSNVYLCRMNVGVNRCICEECASEIDQNLIIK